MIGAMDDVTSQTKADELHCRQGWRQEFSDRELTLPTRGLKYGFQGIVNAKNLRKNSFDLPKGG